MNRIVEKVDDISSLTDFYCGVKSMDTFIHSKYNGLNDFVTHGLTNLWIVRECDEVIGFFALSKSALILNSFDIRNLEDETNSNDIFELRESFPALKIDYLAIREDLKFKGLGSDLLLTICDGAKSDRFSATMFIIVDALDTPEYSAVEFYNKNYFKESEYGLVKNQNKQIYGDKVDTKLMYLPLF